MTEFVQPNIHVVAIHFPIGLFVAGVLAEAFSFLGWRRSTLHVAARWMILLGTILSFPAIFTGLYALSDVSAQQYPTYLLDLLNHSNFSREYPDQRAAMFWHLVLNAGASAVAMLAVCAWIALGDGARRVLHIPIVMVLLLCAAGMAAGAHFGGKLVHEYYLSRDGRDTESVVNPNSPVSESTATPAPQSNLAYPTWLKKAEPYAPPLQVHLWFAGLAIATTCVALATAIRATTEPAPMMPPPYSVDPAASRINDAFARRPEAPSMPVPASRIWLLTAGAVFVTALLGAWFLASQLDTIRPVVLWQEVRSRDVSDPYAVTRRLAHVIGGGVLLLFPLMLALLAKVARRNWLIVGLMGFTLVIVLVAQVWFGFLLLLDTPHGPLLHWNPEQVSSAE